MLIFDTDEVWIRLVDCMIYICMWWFEVGRNDCLPE